MYTISKQQIAGLINVLSSPNSFKAESIDMLQGLLAQPETEYLQFLSDVMTAAGLITHGKQCKALGERLSAGAVKYRGAEYTHPPAPVQPITADDVTDEVLENFLSAKRHNQKMILAAAVNAYHGLKLEGGK
jgi:hypothetical protein